MAGLVPVQAGVRYCRCPGCDAGEGDDPLVWSILKPMVLTCKRCGLIVPNDDIPARNDQKKVPEETVEVLPRTSSTTTPTTKSPPRHSASPTSGLYLSAKRDYEARRVPGQGRPVRGRPVARARPRGRRPQLARLAAILVLRFAQVYPAYATHLRPARRAQDFQQADLAPPYRRGYRTGKWDWTASLDVPLNLVIAYALIRDGPALAEAGRVLDDPNPAAEIERDLFRASAEFVRLQPEEFSEMSL